MKNQTSFHRSRVRSRKREAERLRYLRAQRRWPGDEITIWVNGIRDHDPLAAIRCYELVRKFVEAVGVERAARLLEKAPATIRDAAFRGLRPF